MVVGRNQGHDTAIGERIATRAEGVGGPAERIGESLRVGIDRIEHLLDETEEMRTHPRNAGELGPVGHLVQREPQPELARREGVQLLERQDVRADVVDDVLVVGDSSSMMSRSY